MSWALISSAAIPISHLSTPLIAEPAVTQAQISWAQISSALLQWDMLWVLIFSSAGGLAVLGLCYWIDCAIERWEKR